MKILGIIPSRYASTRFPGKPLADIAGKSMIRRVYERSSGARHLDDLVVATDDERIYDHVLQFGGKAVMTSAHHVNGTSRCLEALQAVHKTSGHTGFDAVVNIQGDEPFIHPDQVSLVAGMLKEKNAGIATLAFRISDTSELFDSNVVKVVFDRTGQARYFSRQAIPFVRDARQDEWLHDHDFYKHIGIYGYLSDVLARITLLEESPLERAEKLEQLRWIEHGFQVIIGITTHQSVAVDAPEDLSKLTNTR